jgi:hypothetical protein
MFNVDGFPSNCLNKCWMLIWVHRHINIFVHRNIDICSTYRHFRRSYQFLRANSQNVPPQKVCHNLTASGSETALIQSPFQTTGSIESTAVCGMLQCMVPTPDQTTVCGVRSPRTSDRVDVSNCWSTFVEHLLIRIWSTYYHPYLAL